MGGIVELALVAMFALGWMLLEWQGRRLDRKRAEREARAETKDGEVAELPARHAKR
jgi:cytochrome oxidase assembly protein ShyY1